jgi:hypothetical protein
MTTGSTAMSDRQDNRIRQVGGVVERHRNKLMGVVAAVMVYAVLGFLVAPWLVKKNAIEAVQENLNAELRLGNVAINPFVLSLRIDGLELDDPAGAPFARIEEIFVNFQLSSLFRWAWTFDEFRIASPQLYLSRNGEGMLNAARFEMQKPEPVEDTPDDDDSGLPRLFIAAFAITNGAVDWSDEVPPEPVDASFGPVSIAVRELNTLPERSGEQAVVITTETAGTLSWSGSLQLNPLKSSGHAAIEGSHFPLTSAYIRHEVGFDILEGDADIELAYSVDTQADGTIRATADNFDLTFRDVLVRTFTPPAADGTTIEDRDVLRLPAMRLAGGSLRWPEQRAAIESIDIDDAVVSLLRDASGNLNVARNPAGPPASTEPPTATGAVDDPAGPSGAAGWDLSLGRFAINRMEIGLEDHSVEPHADLGLRSMDLTVTDVSNAEGAKFPTTLALEFRHGGTATMTGKVSALPVPLLEFDAKVAGASLAAIQAYIDAFADVHVDSGALNVDGHLSHSPDEPLAFKGDIEVVDFLITETDIGSRLGSWASLRAENVAFSAAALTLDISEIGLEKPYGDILITEDGSVNLGRAVKAEPGTEVEGPAEVAVESGQQTDDVGGEATLAVTVGRVVIEDGAADFADQSLPLPFDAAIASLNGNMTTIATTSRDPSTVALEGKVDEFGLVRVSGSVTPLDPALDTDLEVVFQNVEMPKFSAYSIPLAGREIASGRLDLDLGYKLVASRLEGANNIVLREFELGEKVEHPGAMSLPLGLAVALLKDPDGKIDIDLPVHGNVDDPEFRYGGLIWKALTNLIVKIVASPFALLANLVGAESSDLENVNFIAGRADLTPPEQEKIAKLAEALALRPELALEIPGVVDREADGLAIRTAKLDQIVEERIAGLKNAGEDEAMYADQQLEVLETLFVEQGQVEDADSALEQLRVEYTTLIEAKEDEEPQEQLDTLAFSNELRRRLIELQPLADSELDALTLQRANNTQSAIIAVNPELQSRVRLTEPQEVGSNDGDRIRMKVALTTGAGE